MCSHVVVDFFDKCLELGDVDLLLSPSTFKAYNQLSTIMVSKSSFSVECFRLVRYPSDVYS